jgi:hypothetical protein
MRFAYVTSTLLREPLESFIIKEVGVYHYSLYEVTLEGPTITS